MIQKYTKQIEETGGQKYGKDLEESNLFKTEREELCKSFGRDSTQYVAPSPRCDPSMSQRRPGGFALQNAKSKITTTWSSRTGRVMATDAVR